MTSNLKSSTCLLTNRGLTHPRLMFLCGLFNRYHHLWKFPFYYHLFGSNYNVDLRIYCGWFIIFSHSHYCLLLDLCVHLNCFNLIFLLWTFKLFPWLDICLSLFLHSLFFVLLLFIIFTHLLRICDCLHWWVNSFIII